MEPHHHVDPSQVRLKITEKFLSLQGEGEHTGLACAFVRLTGCPLRCNYCDTAYAFHGGTWQTVGEIEAWVRDMDCNLVQITGGEPLAQKGARTLIPFLIDRGYRVLLETAGSEPIDNLPDQCHIVMDLKTPGSGECDRNRLENLAYLKPTDELKFVVTSLDDWEWTLSTILQNQLDERFHVLISPVGGNVSLRRPLAERVIQSGLRLRYQIQLHKEIWGDEPGT